ncbi:MAG: hypothetical protein Q8S73_03450 [Deltaproteobacteria bacterium]|nr:hypothetical protein [Myxococcales bacterium]MDP3213134.1 hypothetical protein [Deltaproteobacteria bacterium]
MSAATRDRWWVRAAALAAAAAASVFVTVRVARAVPGGAVGSSLSFAGTLTGVTGPQTLTFIFKSGATTLCTPTASVTPRADGSFRTAVPLAGCPRRLLDGRDVTFDVRVGARTVAVNQAASTVPYARYASAVGTSLCPTGYTPSSEVRPHCRRELAGGTFDEVVRVGDGATAFWIDRYEASLAQQADGGGARYATVASLPGGFPLNGNYTTPVYAFSRRGVEPFGEASWFIAQEACHLSGKRLPTSAEWITAARGTPDGADCVLPPTTANRTTGMASTCVSAWGADDMVGNLSEYSALWQTSVRDGLTTPVVSQGAAFSGDVIAGLNGRVLTRALGASAVAAVAGLPGAVLHGVPYANAAGGGGGVLAMGATSAPSYHQTGGIGFRCVTTR